MFAAVSVQKLKRAGLYGPVLDKIKRQRAEVLEQSVGSCRFFQINSYRWHGKINFEELAKLAGRFANRLVIDESITLPDDVMINRFYPSEFYNVIAVNTAIRIVDRAKIQLYQRVVGLYDPTARHQQLALELIKYCNTVKIFTLHPDKYTDFGARVLDSFGAPIFITNNIRSLEDCLFTLLPQNPSDPILHRSGRLSMPEFPCPVIAAGEGEEAQAPCVMNYLKCRLSSQLEEHVPLGMDPTYFAGALYELGRMRELGRMAAGRCRLGGIDATLDEAAGWLYQTALERENRHI